MSDFVNYNKRSIDLPGGCKNLADVLQNKLVDVFQNKITLFKWEVKYAKLSEIGRYVARVWDSEVGNVSLSIKPKLATLPDSALRFGMEREPNTTLQATFVAQMGSLVGVSLTRFLQKHGYAVPEDSVPNYFNPHLPVTMICNILPLPHDPFQLAALAIAIFREVCELAEDAPMKICLVG